MNGRVKLKMKKIEQMIRESNGQLSTSTNISFSRLALFTITGYFFSITLLYHFDIRHYNIPMIILVGIMISGLIMGFFTREKDNIWRKK